MAAPEHAPLLDGIEPAPGAGGKEVGRSAVRKRDLPNGAPVASVALPETGRLVTNHLNLMYMLAAGLLPPKGGFGVKYYRDTLDVCPGWLPLFTDRPGRAAVEYSTAEAGHLRPCQVVVSLRDCTGPVMVPTPEGVEKRLWPNEVGGASLVFVPAPLPVSAIQEILFPSRDDSKACTGDARDYGNVSLTDFETRAAGGDFKRVSGPAWPPPHVPPERVARIEVAQAAGGMLAMLQLLANRDAGDVLKGRDPLSLAASGIAFDPSADPPPALSGTVAAWLVAWMQSGASPARAGTALPGVDPGDARRLFWGAVDALAAQAGAVSADDANARLLGYLDGEVPGLAEPLRKHVVELRETLDSLTGLADLTASELFARFKTPLPRALSLLFLRSTCADLLAFEHAALTADDWLAAGLLFGARAGWLTLPLPLRGGAAASAAVSHRMAALSHRLTDSGFDLGPAPARRRLLAERFAGDWDARHQNAALALARALKWTDCLRTRIKLGPGDHVLRVGRGGLEIVLQGETRTVETEVERPRFSERLAAAPIDPEYEAEVIEMLADDSV